MNDSYGKIKRMKKKDIILVAVMLTAALSLALSVKMNRSEGESLRITVDGKEYGIYRLDEDQTIKINKTNTCRIRDGKAWMIQADCPDQVCIHHKPLDHTGGSIVCLPNRVFMTVINNQTDAPDTVAS